MYCDNCGAELADNAKFCSNCGRPQKSVSQTRQNLTDNRWTLANRLALIGVIVAIIAAIAAIVVIPSVQQSINDISRAANPPQLPEEAKRAIDQYLVEAQQYGWLAEGSNLNYSIVAAQQATFTRSILVNDDEIWCVLINGITTKYGEDLAYWTIRRQGLIWSAGGSTKDSYGGLERFRQYSCTIG